MSTTGTRLPRTLATPSSHGWVPGTGVSTGTASSSLISSMPLTSNLEPTRKPMPRHKPGASNLSWVSEACASDSRS